MSGLVLDWLLAPIDPARMHVVDTAIAWHGRLMVLAWGVLLPLGVIIARFCKILPKQDWPRVLDSKLWWHGHLALQYAGGGLMLAGFGLLLADHAPRGFAHFHGLLGYAVIALGLFQFLAGWLRGTKGGPTEPTLRGDHYDMTRRRRIFEHTHKILGYLALVLGLAALTTGLWHSNAPRWMWFGLGFWWVGLIMAFVILQRMGRAIDTYQAIWGPDVGHPGNEMTPIGWGVRRLSIPKDKQP